MKSRHTEPLSCEFHALQGWRAGVDHELEVVTGTPRKLEGPEPEAGREYCEVIEDELGTHQVAFGIHIQLEIECTVERWGSLDIEARAVVVHGVGATWDAVDLKIPEVRKLTNEIKDLLMVPPWKVQLQRSQRPQKRPKIFLHLWDERRGVQPTSLEGLEVREGTKMLDVGVQAVRKEWTTGEDDRDVTSMLEETAFGQGR